ncbi:hypothetical protein [Nostoc sp. UHCC 0870]|uniref:hypothetical protein n=1 Tax=Nostoc sp. UHCC 0870 TaxID=2914041 RepID=UPI001EDF871E|nr:hypothetical protein [Nostoc sp. UHCC 0870]UKO98744.1 hypothetical protein L6494_03135 [Nostoc sp. UHCC 0870]
MLKRVVASLATSVGLLSLNVNAALAKPAVDFTYHKSFYPSSCNITINRELFSCNYGVIGAFNNGTGNLKLCTTTYCLILILNRTQLQNIANGNAFYINQIALQQGNRITNEWNMSMKCAINADALGCLGNLRNGSRVAIYAE